MAPASHFGFRRADLFRPVPQLKRHGNADAGDTRAMIGRQPVNQFGDAGTGELKNDLGRGIGKGD